MLLPLPVLRLLLPGLDPRLRAGLRLLREGVLARAVVELLRLRLVGGGVPPLLQLLLLLLGEARRRRGQERSSGGGGGGPSCSERSLQQRELRRRGFAVVFSSSFPFGGRAGEDTDSAAAGGRRGRS